MEAILKPSRQQRSKAEIKEYEESNLTVREFCELYSISKQTLHNWRNKYYPKVKNPASSLRWSWLHLALPEYLRN